MTVGSCVNLSACSRLSVGLRDIVETLTGNAATLIDSFEYLRVTVETGLYALESDKSHFTPAFTHN